MYKRVHLKNDTITMINIYIKQQHVEDKYNFSPFTANEPGSVLMTPSKDLENNHYWL